MWITSIVGMFVYVFVISSEASLVFRFIGMVSRHIPKIVAINCLLCHICPTFHMEHLYSH